MWFLHTPKQRCALFFTASRAEPVIAPATGAASKSGFLSDFFWKLDCAGSMFQEARLKRLGLELVQCSTDGAFTHSISEKDGWNKRLIYTGEASVLHTRPCRCPLATSMPQSEAPQCRPPCAWPTAAGRLTLSLKPLPMAMRRTDRGLLGWADSNSTPHRSTCGGTARWCVELLHVKQTKQSTPYIHIYLALPMGVLSGDPWVVGWGFHIGDPEQYRCWSTIRWVCTHINILNMCFCSFSTFATLFVWDDAYNASASRRIQRARQRPHRPSKSAWAANA